MDEKTQIIYEKIKEVAKNGRYVNYGDIAPLVGLDMEMHGDRIKIGAVLDCINRVEHRAGRPLLSAVVILKEENKPGAGFFDLAKELRLQSPNQDDLLFWIGELNRVHAYWAKR